jgi:regulator of RNase E activity RraA
METAEVCRLAEMDTPTIANGIELLGVRDPSTGFMGPDIRALTPELGVRVGYAVTARMDTTSPGTDQPENRLLEWLRMMEASPQPVMAVIECVGPRPLHTVTIGDCMALLMKRVGCGGLVTNGCVRDIRGIRTLALACWGAGLTPMHGRIRWVALDTPVCVGGILIQPGDLLHADENGVITIPLDAADRVYDAGVAVAQKEMRFREAVDRHPGTNPLDNYAAWLSEAS